MKIHEAILEVMRDVPVVRKEDRNTQGKGYNFRGIDAVLNALGPVLRDKGVLVCPHVVEHQSAEVLTGSNRTPMRMVTVVVQYTFIGPEGDSLPVTVPGEAFDSGDKAYSKAMSVAFRTALLQTFALPTDDRDPDADSYERSAPATKSKTQLATDADHARAALLDKINEYGLNPADVAQLYVADNGVHIREDTVPERIRSFTDRLQKPT